MMSNGLHGLCRMIFFMMVFSAVGMAQPNLTFKRITVNWPTIEVYFAVGCEGAPMYNMTKQDFRIRENGEEVKDFTLWCPDPSIRCALSVAFVADVSGSMRGDALEEAKRNIGYFIDLLDGVLDEATIITAGSETRVTQQMTTIKPLLYWAKDSLRAAGASRLYDGMYEGILTLINSGVNQCRAVLVFSDGHDNSSEKKPADIISLANRNRIRVFTMGTGYTTQSHELEMIALLTGGRYYQNPNAGQMAAIYSEISTIIFQGFQECVMTYERGCADGSMRTVQVALEDFCGGNDERSRTYRAPLDSTTFHAQTLRLGDVVSTPGPVVTVPLLTDIVHGGMLQPFTMTLRGGEQRRPIADLRIPPGSPLQGADLRVRRFTDSLWLELRETVPVQEADTLLECVFSIAGIYDSAYFPLRAGTEDFLSCVTTEVLPGGYRVVPRLLPLIEPGGEVLACAGETVALTANEGFTAYRWSTGDSSRSIVVTDADAVYVDVVDARGDTLRSAVTEVRFRPARKVWIEAEGPLRVCNPNEVRLHVAGEVGGGTVYWNGNSWPVDTYRAAASGSYWAEVVDSSGCRHPTDTVQIEIVAPPVHLNVSDEEWLCVGEERTLQVIEEYPRYEWSTGDSTRSITIVGGEGGPRVHVTAWDSAGCMSFRRSVRLRTYREPVLRLLPETQPVLCDSAAVDLTASGDSDFVRYMWSTGDSTQTITVRTPGTYALRAVNADGCVARDSVRVHDAAAIPPPTIYAPQGTSLCGGENLPLDGGAGYVAWRWSTGDSTRVITVGDTGMYYVDVTSYGGCVRRSETITVTGETGPPPVISIEGDTWLCPGDTVRLTAPAGQDFYFWSNGLNAPAITVSQPGIYAVTYVSPGGCENTTGAVRVRMREEVPPEITRMGDVLSTTPKAVAYQWFREDARMPGETSSALQLPGTGRYAVEIVDSCGRTLRSEDFPVSVLDAAYMETVTPSLALYPEPASDRLTLRVNGVQGPLRAELIDLLGRRRLLRRFDGGGMRQLDVAALPRGVYILRLTHRDGMMLRRLLLE
jgi:hypothetical protein